MIGHKIFMTKAKTKFKVKEIKATGAPKEEFEWHGEELKVDSGIKLSDDKGTGDIISIRSFLFKANPEVFAKHIPNPQELWNEHVKGIERLLWMDGLIPIHEIEPRLIKEYDGYRFFVTCKPSKGNLLSYKDIPKTLAQLNESTIDRN